MIEAEVVVIATEGSRVRLKNNDPSPCNACKQSCSGVVFSRWLKGEANTLEIESSLPLIEGDHVIIGVKASKLLLASVLIYGLPLLGLIVCALLAEQFVPANIEGAPPDILIIFAAISGFMGMSSLLRNPFIQKVFVHPEILRRL